MKPAHFFARIRSHTLDFPDPRHRLIVDEFRLRRIDGRVTRPLCLEAVVHVVEVDRQELRYTRRAALNKEARVIMTAPVTALKFRTAQVLK